jgi:ABC-type enterochelin transport system substrate-binding protein
LSGCEKAEHNVNISEITPKKKLCVLQVQVAETLSFKTKKTNADYLVVGYANFEIDFEKIKEEENRLIIPSPTIEPIVDYDKSRSYNTSVNLGYTDEMIHKYRKKMFKEAEKLVRKAAQKDEYMNIAKSQAEKILKNMLSEQKDVKIEGEGGLLPNGYEIRKNKYGGYSVFYDGKATGFESISKRVCEEWIRSKR